MATQGVVSITKDGRVQIKIVVGCDGYRAPAVAKQLQLRGAVPDAAEAYNIAQKIGFGCERCRVVLSDSDTITEDDPDELGPLYRSTFDDPKFNPRWEQGIAAHTEIVEL